ncbi:MAG: hypothetical protein CMG00_02695 [Candidatus Marinimicrobia bacterium]|nr:hypothetical protein [Candidatus Neomarinimicrobiota bacterium]|tara:strand:+ start:3162 stop:3812 length:651 start_codon:yes stop_codon:yes gene_type:complete
MDNSLYRIKNLSFKNDKFNLNIKKFDIHRGAIYMFSGNIGSGKSLVVNILSKKLRYGGLVEFDGKDLLSYNPNSYKREVALISDLPSSWCTSETYIKKYIKRYDAIKSNFKNVNSLLRKFGVGDILKRRVCSLSASHKRILDLVSAIAADPKVIVIDDADMYLTSDELKVLKSVIYRKSNYDGITVVLTCRYHQNFSKFASVNITLDSGRIVRVRS